MNVGNNFLNNYHLRISINEKSINKIRAKDWIGWPSLVSCLYFFLFSTNEGKETELKKNNNHVGVHLCSILVKSTLILFILIQKASWALNREPWTLNTVRWTVSFNLCLQYLKCCFCIFNGNNSLTMHFEEIHDILSQTKRPKWMHYYIINLI